MGYDDDGVVGRQVLVGVGGGRGLGFGLWNGGRDGGGSCLVIWSWWNGDAFGAGLLMVVELQGVLLGGD
jgi:hypothetical protein